ncbi:MAG: hypothetical protein ABI690_32880 [Chloroflexota bacterium]
MLQQRFDSTSIEDIITYRHWHAESEHYTGGDSLATALYLGWVIDGAVRLEEFWYAGTRRVALYYFDLIRDEEKMTMPVIGNPYIDQLIAKEKHELVSVGKYRRDKHEIEMEARV